jgi:hypothetical protein
MPEQNLTGIIIGVGGTIIGGSVVALITLVVSGIKDKLTLHDSQIKELFECENNCVTDPICKERREVIDKKIVDLCAKTNRDIGKIEQITEKIEKRLRDVEVSGV